MDEGTKQAGLSGLRTIIAVGAGIAVAHGWITSTDATMIAGALVAIAPFAWGIWNQYAAEQKTKAREVVAVNAGVAVAATGTVGPTVRPVDVPTIIKDFAPPVPPQPPKGTP